jgi:hypothetical protein
MPWSPCDGIRNPAAISEGDSPRQGSMVNAVLTSATAAFYVYANDAAAARRYVRYAARVLRVWFLEEATCMLPNLYYGQIIPRDGGVPKVRQIQVCLT